MDVLVTLSHPIVGTKTIATPDGWKGAVLGMDRHPDFHCLIESFKTPFSLYGNNGEDDGGRDFFKAVADIGVDEEIEVLYQGSENDSGFAVTDRVVNNSIFTTSLDGSTQTDGGNVLKLNSWSWQATDGGRIKATVSQIGPNIENTLIVKKSAAGYPGAHKISFTWGVNDSVISSNQFKIQVYLLKDGVIVQTIEVDSKSGVTASFKKTVTDFAFAANVNYDEIGMGITFTAINNSEDVYLYNFAITAFNDGRYLTIFKGLLPIVVAIELLSFDHTVQIAITQISLWSKFINRFETPVNILDPNDLDGNARRVLTPFTVKLPAQILNKTTEYTGHSGTVPTAEDCFVATTANISRSGFPIIDGVQTTDFMRVLVKDQTDQKQNGVFNAASGAWTRAADANTDVEIENMIVQVTNGTVNGGKAYAQTTTGITIGTSNIVFVFTNFVDQTIMADFGYTSDGTALELVLPARFQQLTQDKKLEEITNSFQYSTEFIGTDYSRPSHVVPDPEIGNVIELIDEFGTIVVDYNEDFSWGIFGNWVHVSTDLSVPSQFRIRTGIFYKINEDSPVELDFGQTDYFTGLVAGDPGGTISSPPMTYSIVGTFTLPKVNRGDLISVYFKHQMFVYKDGTPTNEFQFTNIKIRGGFIASDTKFQFASLTPDSECQGLYVHDVYSSVLDRIIGTDGVLYSPLLGNTSSQSRVYGSNGNASMYVPLQGLQIRGWSLTDKIFSISGKDCWDGLNPAFNLGLSQEIINGQEVISIVPKADLYDDSDMSILLSNVNSIKKTYDQDSLVNRVDVGNEKWESAATDGSGGISGLDDSQTKRSLASIFKHVGKTLTIFSKWIFAGLTIELTRRSSTKKSANYKYDNDIFLLAVKEVDGVVSPQLDEAFSAVSGLSNEASRYNKILTPYRVLLRNLNLIAGGLQDYATSVLKFLSGEGNYDMSSTTISTTNPEDFGGNPLSEKQDIPIGSNFLHRAELYKIDHFLTLDQYRTFQARRHVAIGVSQTESGHKKFLVKSIEFTPYDGTLKVSGWFKEKFDIVVTQTESARKIFSEDFDDTLE